MWTLCCTTLTLTSSSYLSGPESSDRLHDVLGDIWTGAHSGQGRYSMGGALDGRDRDLRYRSDGNYGGVLGVGSSMVSSLERFKEDNLRLAQQVASTNDLRAQVRSLQKHLAEKEVA